jgi:hypothetical protein
LFDNSPLADHRTIRRLQPLGNGFISDRIFYMTCTLIWRIHQQLNGLVFLLNFKRSCKPYILTHIFMWVFNRIAAGLPLAPGQEIALLTSFSRFSGQDYFSNWSSPFISLDYLILYQMNMD